MEVGVVSAVAEGLDDRLDNFVATFEQGLRLAGIDEKPNWSPLTIGAPQFDETIASSSPSRVQFTKASLDPEEVRVARELAAGSTRNLVLGLCAQQGFVREREMLGRKSSGSPEDLVHALEALRGAGVVRMEYLLECKRTGAPLTQLASPEYLNASMNVLRCPSCGTPFGQEALSPVYSPSDLARRLLQGSLWMTILTTSILSELGVPLDSILWNVSEAGGEVDMLVGFAGQLWIFELKDREFGAGDAYPLQYRQARYGADRAVIITTDKIALDAKRVFEEVNPGRGYLRSHYTSRDWPTCSRRWRENSRWRSSGSPHAE
ncbi:MAG: hypothetical protein AB1609_22920 [Bacillota bacterium]